MKAYQQIFAIWKNFAMIPMGSMCFGSLNVLADWEGTKVTKVTSKKIKAQGDS